MTNSILKDKSVAFALSIIETYKRLREGGENIMSKQLLRCGTSIGANIAEANMAQSLADFAAKMYIALKEANETLYWLELLSASGYLNDTTAQNLTTNCHELLKMLVSTTKKTAPRSN